MKSEQVKVLNPTREIFNFAGGIANDPSFVRKPSVFLSKDDFVEPFHKVLFFALNNLIKTSGAVQPIKVLDVDSFLQKYPKYYKLWNDNEGPQYLEDATQNSNNELLDHDYQSIKKYAVLRRYLDNGIDIRDLLAYDSPDIQRRNDDVENVENMTTSEIIDHYSSKVNAIRKEWQDLNTENSSFAAGDDIETLVERLQEEPDLGYPFSNGFYNRLFGGMRASKYLLRSTSTGGGKTRSAIRDICHVAFDEIYVKGQGWKSMGVSAPCLFISTELDKDELQVLMLAYLTGISSSRIGYGNFTKDMEERLTYAANIIKKADLYFEYIEDFNSDDIEMLIDQYVLDKKVEYVNFDYIQASPKLMTQLKSAYGMGLREDQALVNLSKELKRMATKYLVFIMSSTQVNGSFLEDDNDKSRTEYSLRGGKSIADKADFGVMTARPNHKDMMGLNETLQQLNCDEPDYAHWVYKNRNGAKGVVIWTKYDMSNMREEPLFITDYNYNLQETIKPLEIQFDKSKNNLDF